MMEFALVTAVAADTLTYLLLPPGHEANPLVAAGGPLTLLVRWVAVALLFGLLVLAERKRLPYFGRIRRPMLLVGALVGVVGAASNMLVVARL